MLHLELEPKESFLIPVPTMLLFSPLRAAVSRSTARVQREPSEAARCASEGDSQGHPSLLAGFFSILLKVRFEARRGLVEYRGGGAREGFVVCVVEGIDTKLDQAGRQQVEKFF